MLLVHVKGLDKWSLRCPLLENVIVSKIQSEIKAGVQSVFGIDTMWGYDKLEKALNVSKCTA